MRSAIAVILAGTLLGLVAPPSFAGSDWVDVKDAESLRALFSNKTHRSRAYVAHYRADGEGISIPAGSNARRPRSWQIKGSDQVCAGPKQGDATCFRFQRSRRNPAEVLAIGERKGQQVMHWFTVENGIPKF